MLQQILPQDLKSRIALFAVLGVISYQWWKSREMVDELETQGVEVPGRVISYESTGRSSAVTQFEYRVGNTLYRTSSIEHLFNDCLENQWCIGERYMVRYSRLHPENAKVLWDKHLPREEK